MKARIIRWLIFGKAMLLTVIITQVLVCLGPFESRAWSAPLLTIGLMEEPQTLNLWLARDRWSIGVLSLMYQPLYTRDPKTLKLIPWLAAEKPVFDKSRLTCTVKLRPARWSDGSPLTSQDVAFTANLVKEFKIPRFNTYWKFIKKIETPDAHTVEFFLKRPMAVFVTRTLTLPIVSKKEWGSIAEKAKAAANPLDFLLRYKIEKPISSGPFVLNQWKRGAYLFVTKNKYFFGTGKKIQGYTLGPYIGGIIFKFYGTTDAAVMAIKRGNMDMFWWGIKPGYLPDLKGAPDIRLFHSQRSALYYMGFNLRKAPFNDVHLRQAIAFLINKHFIIQRILQGDGQKMNTLIPPGNHTYYCPDVPRYGEGMTRQERIKRAYEILKGAGYTWDVSPVQPGGKIVQGRGIRLPDGKPMRPFTILTPPADYDPERAMAGMMIQEWLREVGMPASSRPMAFGALIDQVSVQHRFDTFILGYGHLSLDPDYLRTFFSSSQDRKRGGNKSGYHNPEFDRIANASAATMDEKERQKLVWEMQKILMRDLPYIPLYSPDLIEAVRTDKFTGWVPMLEGIGNIWSFCVVRPK